MQQAIPEITDAASQTNNLGLPPTSSQDGFQHRDRSSPDGNVLERTRSSSPKSVAAGSDVSGDGISARQLDEQLRRLSTNSHRSGGRPKASLPGQRISEYEKALTPSTPRQALGFKVIRRPDSPSDGVQLTDFPNEILTHILSHLHPDSHASVALVSKRFYALVTEPHAWRMAFLRFFPGQEALDPAFGKNILDGWHAGSSDLVRSESRYFTRMTPLASWRSEYLLRTRLLRSVARGKPGTTSGGIGASSRSSQAGKRASAVLTYNSKLPWTVSHIHAVFSNGKKGPKMIHGTRDMCVSTVSDPTIGKVEKWGLDDPFSFAQLDEVFPNLELYGLGDGPAAMPNVMDVSQPFGMFGGEGFPGGRVYFRATGELRGRYLSPTNNAIIDMTPEVPKIPELSEAICSVWIAKSSAVPSTTQSMVGMMAGSSLGVVTTYALKFDATGSRYFNGEITARWVLSPGVPIIAIKVDDSYNLKRKALGRIWAVVLNALGEVFYLSQTPTPSADKTNGQDSVKIAWMAGRSVSWELIEMTRREARPDEFDKNAVRGAYSPRSPSDAMNMSKAQVVAEAREIEKFLRYKPAHFRKVCKGWDMCRKLEVDFAGGDGDSAGEAIFVVCPGGDEETPAKVTRHMRRLVHGLEDKEKPAPSPIPLVEKRPSIFGSNEPGSEISTTSIIADLSRSQTPHLTGSLTPWSKGLPGELREDWQVAECVFNGSPHLEITASGIDSSTFALLCHFEDPLNGIPVSKDAVATPTTKHSTAEIPGRRSRFVAVGTDDGRVIAWNARDTATSKLDPVRVIQTESPEISCLALSSLYVIHGGSDGLVQAWDPLASSLDPVRTLNSRSSGRVPRHIVNANPALRDANYSAVGAIFLDPDPTVLRGVLAFGTFLRYWTYSSTSQPAGRKRRLRHSDVHGRLASRRHGGTVQGYIAAEEAELRHEQEHHAREQARLRSRFGVGLGDLTEEEAVKYAQMISEEAFLLDEQRRTSASDTGSAADMGESASSFGSLDTVTPEPSVSGLSPPSAQAANSAEPSNTAVDEDDDYEQQIQRAIRLSLMEGVNDVGESPRANSSTDFDFQVKYKSKKGKRSASNSPSSSQAHTPLVQYSAPQSNDGAATSSHGYNPDEDLELALRLSLEEEQERQARAVGLGIENEDFPELEVKGKGKGVYRG